MFAMDFTSRRIAWIEKIREQLESFCTEVDVRAQEQFGYVESQVQIASENVKQFCSVIMEEMFTSIFSDAEEEEASTLPSEDNRKEQLPHCELLNISVEEDDIKELSSTNISLEEVDEELSSSNIYVEEDNKEELSSSNSFSLVYAVEIAVGEHIDSSLQKEADIGMKMSFEDNSDKKLSSCGSSEIVASTEGTLNLTSLPCEANTSSGKGVVKVECQEIDPSVKVGENSDVVGLEADILNNLLLTCSTYSTASTESCPDIDEIFNGECMDHHINEQAIDSVPIDKFDWNFVLADRDDFVLGTKINKTPNMADKKNLPRLQLIPVTTRMFGPTYEVLKLEPIQSNADWKAQSYPNGKLELSHEESDWEII